MDKQKKIIDFSIKSISRGITLIITPLIIYTVSLFTIIYTIFFVLKKLNLNLVTHIIFFTIILLIGFLSFIIIETFLTALVIKFFRIKVKPGEHELTIKNKEFFKHLLFFTLYRPALKLIGIIPLVPLRLKFLKIIGLKIEKNSIIAGTELIDEPFSVSIGSNTVIGGMSTIFTHISHKKMIHKPVIIGNNCFIGNKSVIMPGSIIEDNVILKPNSVVIHNQKLKKNKTYSGNPATETKK